MYPIEKQYIIFLLPFAIVFFVVIFIILYCVKKKTFIDFEDSILPFDGS